MGEIILFHTQKQTFHEAGGVVTKMCSYCDQISGLHECMLKLNENYVYIQMIFRSRLELLGLFGTL